MGSFIGHAVPGTMFILISIWWYAGALRVCFRNIMTSDSTTLVHQRRKAKADKDGKKIRNRAVYGCMGGKLPFEPITKVSLAIIGILGELLYEKQWALLDKEHNFVKEHLNNYAHASMFGFFGLSGIIDLVMIYDVAPFPDGLDFVFASLAFFVEGVLFYFHLDGRPHLSVRVHTFIYMLAFFTAMVFVIEMWASNQSIPALVRAFLTSVHGAWFFQIAFVLHGPNPWKNTSENIEFVAIAFVMHVFTWAVVYLGVFVAVYRGCYASKLGVREPLLQEESADEDF
ncbi:transmembrane protein 45B-like [Actinia tenebrosa]|uniref:Transmembrane protein 45B-like n=1 Tax=Actinia tenebrosa TaxID=6105 RepID=A0A6P8IWP9_ACTTE|nr:transmembrane protein 45B-like [Actinia tenebrosa]